MIFILLFNMAFADIAIFDSKRPISLSNSEKTERDYYLDGGIEKGLKNGQIVTVNRRLTVYDSLLNRSLGEMLVPVAKLKIVLAQRGLSVAHFYEPAKSSVSLEDNFVMIGDRLDLTTAEVELEKPVTPPSAE